MRRVGLLASGIALVTLLAACGQQEPNNANSNPTTTSAEKSVADVLSPIKNAIQDKKSAKTAVVIKATGDTPEETKLTGALHLEANDNFSYSLDYQDTKSSLTALTVAENVYVKTPDTIKINAKKPWIKAVKNGKDNVSQSFAPIVSYMGEQSSPTRFLALVQAAGKITNTSKENLDGIASTKYVISIDIAKASEATQDGLTKTELEELKSKGASNYEQTIWVNSDNLPVRIITVQKSSNQHIERSVSYREWGQSVSIADPPASQIANR